MKQLTREQVQSRKEKAERFVRDVLDDDNRADEIADEYLEDYAARRHFSIINPQRSTTEMATKRELEERIAELEDENSDLNDRLDSIADLVGSEDEDEDEDDEAAQGEEDEDEDDSGN